MKTKKKVTKFTKKVSVKNFIKKKIDTKEFRRTSLDRVKDANPLANATIFEPKLENRWICHIEELGKEIVPHFLVRQFQRPALYRETSLIENTTNKISHGPYLERFVPKKGSQISLNQCNELHSGNITLEAYDPVEPSASKLFTHLLQTGKRFNVRLTLLSPNSKVIEEWTYTGCKVTRLAFSCLSWGSDSNPATVSATISVSKPKLA